MEFIGRLLVVLLDIYFWIIIISVVISWLIAFDVVNARSAQAQNLIRLLNKATDPVYRRLRKFIPDIGGIDITPMIVIFALVLLQNFIRNIFIYG
ncbi:MAG: YggT family protein [Alphaproteobacteria bacterium]|jgi:YggT family protein|nr:YggT family protein [Alphaproteobacteria bacterium]MDP7222340.1 YggT family protein [Alphaproteobacteria bacterium]